MPIPVAFVTRLAVPLIVTALFFSENYGPEQVKLYDQVTRAGDLAVSRARKEGEGPTETFDYIVIGGGSAGAVVANRLSASGNNTVLLIEAGGDPNPISDVPLGRRHINAAPAELVMPYRTVPQANACVALGSCPTPRAKTLGGCSVLNGALYNRCNRNDFDLWANFTGNPVWSFSNVVEAFKSIESYHGFYEDNPGPNHGTSGEVYVGKMDYIPGSDIIFEALMQQMIPVGDLNSGLFAFGYSKIDYNIEEGLRRSSYHAFLEPILGRPNLKVYRYAWATKVHLDATKRAVGVTYVRHGQTRYVSASKEIILSAGAYESPKLLMLSGIGPAQHLGSHGIPVEIDNDAVGNYLQDHIAVGGRTHAFSVNQTYGQVNFLTDESLVQYLENGTGPLNAFEFGPVYAPQLAMGYSTSTLYNDREWPDIQSYIHEELVAILGRPLEETFYIDYALMRPESYGTVRLASTNYLDQPLIDPKFFDVPNDLERLIDGMESSDNLLLTSPILQSIGIKRNDRIVPEPNCAEFTYLSRDYWRCFAKQRSSTHFHPTSTCRMGPNSSVAVVDSELRVFGATGLRVIDASIMPFVPSGNTNFPAMMVGHVGAQIILQQ